MFREARDRSCAGASRVPPAVVERDGVSFAHVSYNGRVWAGAPSDWSPGMVPLYDPRRKS